MSKRTTPSTTPDAIAETVSSLDEPPAPLVCGPFLGEPGFETLYWVPFLKNATAAALAGGRDVVVISRGGTEALYGDMLRLGARYLDVLDVLTPEAFLQLERERMQDSPMAKNQKRRSGVEDKLLEQLGFPGACALRPASMFRLLKHHPDHEVCDWSAGPAAEPAEKRPDVTVVKFWFGSQLPRTSENVERIKRWIERFADQGPVVALLNPHSLELVQEMDSPFDRLVEEMGLDTISTRSARTNLGDQIAAVAGASRFVSTYGGLAYLSLYTGTPLVCFYENPKTVFTHHYRNFATAVGARNPKSRDASLSLSLIDLRMV